jgi:methionine sulfoxide reductase heme-binding subunit
MQMVRNNKLAFWALLALPAALMLANWSLGRIDTMEMLHPTGEWSARFMILAMMIGPLLDIFGPRRWIAWAVARRRYLGVAAFVYALLHLIFYLIDMGNLDDVLAEWLAPGIWTGWAAFVLMLPLALTSNEAAVRALKTGWKKLQRLVYPAALMTLLHWFWVHNSYAGALIHFAPLVLLWLARFVKKPLSPMKPQGV